MYVGLHVKYSLFLSDYNETWILATYFGKKNTHILNFVNIRPVGANLLHVEGQTDMTKLIVGCCKFAIRVAGLRDETWTRDFSNISHECKPLDHDILLRIAD
jgi:hypothetical protein